MNKIIIAVFLVLLLLVAPTAYAQTATDEATESSDVIRDKVREVVDNQKTTPKAYVGLITDIVESTLQIENKFGEIEQVDVLDSADLVTVIRSTRAIELEDIAIGDFVIAMGFLNENKVLEASRIVITEKAPETNRKAFKGKVSDKNKNAFTLITDGDDISVNLTKNTEVTSDDLDDENNLDFTDLVDGDTVIVTGKFDKGIVEARRVHIEQSAPSQTSNE